MVGRDGEAAPQVVRVRMGNCRKAALFAVVDALLPDLRRLLAEGKRGIEIH